MRRKAQKLAFNLHANGDGPVSREQSMGEDPCCSALLLAVAQQPLSTDHEFLSRHISNINNWDHLFRLGADHRMLPLLYTRLTEAGVALPREAEQQLQQEYMRNKLLCLANTVELIGILETLDQLSIPALPVKGVLLASSVYGHLSARSAGDLDFLIDLRDRVQAIAAVRERGYELLTPVKPDGMPALPHWHEYCFVRPSDGIVLELRWCLDLMHPSYERDLGLEWVWPHRRRALLAGADVPDISPELLLLILCMHGCKHAWSRLMWICDVAKLLRSHPTLDWIVVMREARLSGLERPLALGILLAHQIGGVSAPEGILCRFESDRVASGMAANVIAGLFAPPGAHIARRMLYRAQLIGLRNLCRYVLSFDFLRMNERNRLIQYARRNFDILHHRLAA